MPLSVRIQKGTAEEADVGIGDRVVLNLAGQPVGATVKHIEVTDDPRGEYAFTVQLERTVEYSWESYLCYVDSCKVFDKDVKLED